MIAELTSPHRAPSRRLRSPRRAPAWSVADLSDDDLMHFVARCDDMDAFAELVRRYESTARRWAQRRLHDVHRAEDVVQEAFLRLFSARARYEASARFDRYLQRIVINLCNSRQRRERARPADALSPADEDSLTAAEDAPQSVDPRLEKLAPALERVPRLHREVLELYYLEELSCEDVATRTGRSVSAIKSLLFRARESLRKALVESGNPTFSIEVAAALAA